MYRIQIGVHIYIPNDCYNVLLAGTTVQVITNSNNRIIKVVFIIYIYMRIVNYLKIIFFLAKE